MCGKNSEQVKLPERPRRLPQEAAEGALLWLLHWGSWLAGFMILQGPVWPPPPPCEVLQVLSFGTKPLPAVLLLFSVWALIRSLSQPALPCLAACHIQFHSRAFILPWLECLRVWGSGTQGLGSIALGSHKPEHWLCLEHSSGTE